DYAALVVPAIKGIQELNLKVEDFSSNTTVDELFAGNFANSPSLITDALNAVKNAGTNLIHSLKNGLYATVGVFDRLISTKITVNNLDAGEINVEGDIKAGGVLCLGQTCVNEEQLKKLLEQSGRSQTGSVVNNTGSPEPASSSFSSATDSSNATPEVSASPVTPTDSSSTSTSATTEDNFATITTPSETEASASQQDSSSGTGTETLTPEPVPESAL
ncbi:MAG: hypothetical protein AAB661_01110, partial [Patescibacteria group bacterium]